MDRTEPNLASRASLDWHMIDGEISTVEQLVAKYNRHKELEAIALAQTTTESARSLMRKNYMNLQKAFWKVNATRLLPLVERTDEGLLRLKDQPGKAPVVTDVAIPPPAKKMAEKVVEKAPEKKIDAKSTKNLSVTERAILLSGLQKGTPMETVATEMDLDDKAIEDLSRAVEESNAAERRMKDFVYWAAQRADTEVDALSKRTGEGLWTDAVTVEVCPSDPTSKFVMVRSSTAPFHGVTVKHDFRANGKPVNVNHDQMFRQFDGQRIIRSKVIAGRSHEYYAKALQYQEGMYLKGYFTVDGTEKGELTRYYVCRKDKIVRISEAEYRDLENRAASKK